MVGSVATLGELLDYLETALEAAKEAVQLTSDAKKATDAGNAAVETVDDIEDASSFVDDVTLDAETVLEPGADLPPTAEEIGPLYRTLRASQPTIHGVKTDVHDIVITLAPVGAFAALLAPILARRLEQSSSLVTSVRNVQSVSAELQRRYTDETLPPGIAQRVEAANAALRPIQAELRDAVKNLQAVERQLGPLGSLESIGRALEPIHDTLRAARESLKAVRGTLRQIRKPLLQAKEWYDRWKSLATKKIEKLLSDSGFPAKKLEAFASSLENQVQSFIRLAKSPVDGLKARLRDEIPKLPLGAVQQQIQQIDRQLSRLLDPVVPRLRDLEKVAGRGMGISAPRRSGGRRRAAAHK